MRFFERVQQTFKQAVQAWKNSSKKVVRSFKRRFGGYNNSQLKSNETIFSVITRLSSTLGALPLKLYENYKEQPDSDLTELIARPNQNMSGFEFINQLEVSRNRDGNGYALIIRDKYQRPIQLIPIASVYVTPFLNLDDNALWYEVNMEDFHAYVYNDDMIHVKHIHGPESLVGISPLDVLKNALDYDKAVSSFSLNEMDKMDTFIVKYENFVDDEAQEALVKNFEDYVEDNGGVLIQQKGQEIERLDRDFNPGDVSDSDKITRTRIANAFNVPLTFLNDTTGTGVNSNEQLMTQFVQMTLTPIAKQYEFQFNNKLLSERDRRKGYYFKFNMNGLMRGDVNARTQFYQAMIRNGVYSQNDVRRLEDLPPSEDKFMDKHWISGDLYPVDMDPTQRKGVKNSDSSSTEEQTDQVLGNGKTTE